MSCEGGNDGELGCGGGSGDGGSGDAGEVVAVGPCDAFDDAELAEAGELAGDGGRGERRERGSEVGAADAGDIESGSMESFEAAGEIIESRKEGKVAAVAGEEGVAEVVEAVDGLLDRGEGAAGRALAMFHFAVVLEGGDIVAGCLQAQHEGEFIVHLDCGAAVAMLDAGSLDAGGELAADLLGELRCDLAAEDLGPPQDRRRFSRQGCTRASRNWSRSSSNHGHGSAGVVRKTGWLG